MDFIRREWMKQKKSSLIYFHSFALTVSTCLEAPTIANGGTQQVIEGEVAKINCNAYGEPTPVVTWQRNGVRVETGVRYIAEDTVFVKITYSKCIGFWVGENFIPVL